MKYLNKLYNWYGKRNVWIAFILIVILLIAGIFFTKKANQPEEAKTETLPTVAVDNVGSLSNEAEVSLVGKVEAVSQAELKSDVGGRVVAVNAKLGDQVPAGKLIVQLENSTQRAAVLQAEGAYEAAVAAAAQSDIGANQAENAVTTAQNNLKSAQDSVEALYREAFTSNNQIVLQQIDDFYRNPEVLRPSVLIDARTNENFLVDQRMDFRTLLKDWREKSVDPSTTEAPVLLDEIEANTSKVLAVVDVFIGLLSRAEENVYFTQAELDTALTAFNSAKATLNTILSKVQTNRTNLSNLEQALINAESALTKAEISGTNSEVSAANAQVKQALGSLRNAQANLAKTLISTPISGNLNSLDVKVGDFIAPQASLGFVANNNALEITTFVGESDRDLIEVGQKLLIDNQYEGVIVNISPAINPVTKKIEVKIATESELIKNGDSVLVTITNTDQAATTNRIMVPLTAIKFTEKDGVVFVVEDNTLVARDVSIGEVEGSFVEILDGITPTTEIVVDARGKAAGQKVEAITN